MVRVRPIQSLWSGYGECFRANFDNDAKPVVVKAVTPPSLRTHPKGWNGAAGHRRKLRSFKAELAFYNDYQPGMPASCDAPSLLFSDVRGDDTLMVLEDLHAAGYCHEQLSATVAQCYAPLKWLARFHAHFLGAPASKLWPQGSYWHLATRQEEWRAMPDGPLKTAAGALDKALADAKFQTLVHGDAKIANFCFTENMAQCAAIDFQYTGKGSGIIDVAYFLGSALSDDDLQSATQDCLDYYFRELRQALGGNLDKDRIEAEWRALYPVACADFHRFLAGWSPEHRKINAALRAQTQRALALINSPSTNTR